MWADYGKEYWEDVFVEADPWRYEDSPYEAWKFSLTLSLLGPDRPRRALEIGCAEGHLTERLAPCVGALAAFDISSRALERAKARCGRLDNVTFAPLDIVADPLPPGEADLILASEVLYYLPIGELQAVADKLAAALAMGGLLLLAHGNLVTDDPGRTGFDWGHPFGARTIGEAFARVAGLSLVRQLRTPLFTLQLFRRADARGGETAGPELREAPLPDDLALEVELEKTIVWGGATITRDAARAAEQTSRAPILMYHAVRDDGPPELAPFRVSCERFREHLRWLRSNGYHSLSLEDFADHARRRAPIPGRPVILTFDDGFEDFFANAWPALERADFNATVFVVTDGVGGEANWDKVTGPQPKLMGWREIQTLDALGVAIGAHSASHRDYLTLSQVEVRRESERSQEALADRLGRRVPLLAYPYGRSNAEIRKTVAASGFRIAVTTDPGCASFGDDLLALPRVEIVADDDVAGFARKVTEATRERRAAPAARKPLSLDRAIPATGGRAEAPGGDMPIRPDYARALAARLDAIVGEFVRLQNQLLNELQAPSSLQSKLVRLFALPVTGRAVRLVDSGYEVAPSVRLYFDTAHEVLLTIDVKSDHTLSPPDYLNTLKLDLVAPTGSAWFEVEVEWGELSSAKAFQVGLYAQASRATYVVIQLRLPLQGGSTRDLALANFELSPTERNLVGSGELGIPDLIGFDLGARPKLQILFDARTDLSLLLHYFNIYFA